MTMLFRRQSNIRPDCGGDGLDGFILLTKHQQFPDWESFGGIAGLEVNADGLAR